MTLTNTDLQQLFLDGESYAKRPFCLSTDGEYLARAAAAMPRANASKTASSGPV